MRLRASSVHSRGSKIIRETCSRRRRIKRESHQIKEKERQEKADALAKQNKEGERSGQLCKQLSTSGSVLLPSTPRCTHSHRSPTGFIPMQHALRHAPTPCIPLSKPLAWEELLLRRFHPSGGPRYRHTLMLHRRLPYRR